MLNVSTLPTDNGTNGITGRMKSTIDDTLHTELVHIVYIVASGVFMLTIHCRYLARQIKQPLAHKE